MADKSSPDPAAETVYLHSLDAQGRLITIRGTLVEQKDHSLVLQHSSGDQHVYYSAYHLDDFKVGDHYRAFAFARPNIDAYERLFQLPEVCHPDGDPEAPFDAAKHAVEIFKAWQAADIATSARAVASDLLAEEEDLKAQVFGVLQSLQSAGKVAADFVQDVGRTLGLSAPASTMVAAPAAAPALETEQASVGVARRAPVMFSRRTLPVRSDIIISSPVPPVPPVPTAPAGQAEIPADRAAPGKGSKRGKKVRCAKAELLTKAEKKRLQKKMGWLNP